MRACLLWLSLSLLAAPPAAAVELVRGPYLQAPARDGMTVVFDLDEPCDFPHAADFQESVHHYVAVEIQGTQVQWTARLEDGSLFDEVTFDAAKTCSVTAEPPPEEGGADDEASGCACRTDPVAAGSPASLLGALAALGFLARKRRRARRLISARQAATVPVLE